MCFCFELIIASLSFLCFSPPTLDRMLVHHRVTPQQYVTGTHWYTWVKRDKMDWSSLSKETMQWARLEPWTSRSGVRGVNYLVTHASTMNPYNFVVIRISFQFHNSDFLLFHLKQEFFFFTCFCRLITVLARSSLSPLMPHLVRKLLRRRCSMNVASNIWWRWLLKGLLIMIRPFQVSKQGFKKT